MSDVVEKIENGVENTRGKISNTIDNIKSWSGWSWLKKWGSYVIIIALVITVVILGIASGARYAAGNCPEVMAVDKGSVQSVLSKCEKKDRGDFFLELENRGLVPDSFTIYEVFEYRESGLIKGKTPDQPQKQLKKSWFKKIFGLILYY